MGYFIGVFTVTLDWSMCSALVDSSGNLFHMLPQCAHMPYLGPSHPLQGATLGTDFSDLAKNGLGFDLHEPQV